jgi:tRNA A37 N6-isopentenylltransferase MiaA
MFAAGVEAEVRDALTEPLSATAIHALGLRDVAERPRAEAVEALIRRTTRYAAYQRKWMRRIPGLIPLAADRPANAVADELVQIAEQRGAEVARA